MTREDFKAHVEETIEGFIPETERRIGQRLERFYCFNWIGAKTAPVPQAQVAEFITQQAYMDAEHIYPCFDLGVGDMLADGRLLLVGYRAAYPPGPWSKNWTGRDGPFVFIIGQKLAKNLLTCFHQRAIYNKSTRKQGFLIKFVTSTTL